MVSGKFAIIERYDIPRFILVIFSPRLLSACLLYVFASSTLIACKRQTPPSVSSSGSSSQLNSSQCQSRQLSAQQVFDFAKNSVAVVETPSGSGTAFIISKDSSYAYLLTNSHVVENYPNVKLIWFDDRITDASIIANGRGSGDLNDLALLKTTLSGGAVLTLSPTTVKIGSDVVAIGAPQGLNFSLTRGIVSSLREQNKLIQIDAPINPGNSGGPILDQSGCVIGVATFKLENSEGLNFALAASVASEYLRQNLNSSSFNANSFQVPSQGSAPFRNSPGSSPSVPSSPGLSQRCWYKPASGSSSTFLCRISRRKDPRGYEIYDIVSGDYSRRTVILEPNNNAQIYSNGRREDGQWRRLDAANFFIQLAGGQFGFTL